MLLKFFNLSKAALTAFVEDAYIRFLQQHQLSAQLAKISILRTV